MASRGSGSSSPGKSWWYLLLLIPFVAVLFPQFYDSATPVFGGMPYFYWYQLVWIVLSGVVTGIVFLVTR